MVRRERGITVMEVMTSLAVVTILLTAALGGEDAQQRTIADAFDRLEAELALSSRLDAMRAGFVVIEPGRRPVDVGRAGMATERVRKLADGLYDVRLALHDARTGVRVELATQIARGEQP
jgi:hypothetical protein